MWNLGLDDLWAESTSNVDTLLSVYRDYSNHFKFYWHHFILFPYGGGGGLYLEKQEESTLSIFCVGVRKF